MELERKISHNIIKWYKESNNALLIKGARQVGKTYIIRSTLNNLNVNYIEINLIETPSVISLFNSFNTIDELIMGLSIVTDKPIIKGETVIFLDEIQIFKEIITKIKFLVDEGSFKYVLSGSLLGIELYNIESAPVGYLTTYTMYPLDFEEFLQIINITTDIIHYIKSCLKDELPIMDTINDKMLSLFKQYLVVGGMPQAITKFVETHNLNDVLEIHHDIVYQYKLDFTKYETNDKKLMISNIYDLIPSELLKQNRRFIISDLKQGLHFNRIQNSFLWLEKAGVVHTVYNATEPRLPLKLNQKQSLFKLYLSDIGLLTSIYGMAIKGKILNNDSDFNSGGLYENVVAMQLASKGFDLYYYNSNKLGELDFVIELNNKITPIEVKSGKDYTLHSALNNCLNNKQYQIDLAIVFANTNIKKVNKILYLPVYMVSFIENNSMSNPIIDIIEF